MPFEHVTVFDDEHADERYHGLIQDVEGGYTRSVALIVPEGPVWLLPVYELALMTAERASSMGEEGLCVSVMTAEPAPLAALGEAASSAVSGAARPGARARVLRTPAPRFPRRGGWWSAPTGPSWRSSASWRCPASRVVRCETCRASRAALCPWTTSPGCRAPPSTSIAAGDAANLPLKHGGLGAQQADVAAAGIAAMAGADVTPEPLRPVIRAVLHTGTDPLYITARIQDGTVESEVTTEPAWPADEKIVAEELGPFLDSLD